MPGIAPRAGQRPHMGAIVPPQPDRVTVARREDGQRRPPGPGAEDADRSGPGGGHGRGAFPLLGRAGFSGLGLGLLQFLPVQGLEIHRVDEQRWKAALADHLGDRLPSVGQQDVGTADLQRRLKILARNPRDLEDPGLMGLDQEIGRASCRERV